MLSGWWVIWNRRWRSSREASKASSNTLERAWFVLAQGCQPDLSRSTSLAATAAKTAGQFSTCCGYYCIIQQNWVPFCCHHIPFPWDREVLYGCCLLLEQLFSDPHSRQDKSFCRLQIFGSAIIVLECLWMWCTRFTTVLGSWQGQSK